MHGDPVQTARQRDDHERAPQCPRAGDGAGRRVVEHHVAERPECGEPNSLEVDPGAPAHQAVGAVAPGHVRGVERVGTVRALDRHGDAVVVFRAVGHPVSAPYVRARGHGAVLEQFRGPCLREGEGEREIGVQCPEVEPVVEDGEVPAGYPAAFREQVPVRAAEGEGLDRPGVDRQRPGVRVDLRFAFQDDRGDAGQAQLAGQPHARRPAADDDDVLAHTPTSLSLTKRTTAGILVQ